MADCVSVDVVGDTEKSIKITASSLSFQLYGRRTSKLLFKDEDLETIFLVIIGPTSGISCLTEGDVHASVRTNLLDSDWNEFWLTWNRGVVSLGTGAQADALVHKKVPVTHKVKHVTLCTRDTRWKLDLGPIPPETKSYSVPGGELQWVAVEDNIPVGAVVGGHEGQPMYVVRGPHRGSLTPGKLVSSEGIPYIPWGGESVEVPEIEMLTGYNLSWVADSLGRVPSGAFPAGHSEHRETLWIGRARHDGHLIVGKVQPSHNACYVPYQGKEVACREYEVLVDPSKQDPRVKETHKRGDDMGGLRGILRNADVYEEQLQPFDVEAL